MSTQTASSSSSSSSSSFSSSSLKYDVFLSFCRVDTCKNFTDHLYIALRQKGIITFRNDDEILEQGKYISSQLLKAIEESKYSIIVLSTNYASSRRCLIELAKIVECIEETKLTVLPIFYHVDPSDVTNQTGTLAEAFEKHEKDPKINKEDVQAWKDALKEVGNISGWDLHDRHESIIIQEILERISTESNLIFQRTISKELVGIESRVMEMLDLYLVEGSGGVRFVGICGMGGMGKTTLAQEIYERISGSFEASSFIADVREKTKNHHLVSLQQQLLSNILKGSRKNISNVFDGINVIGNRLRNKKVLIVLDDVDGEEQLEALVGNHDWFGSGSRIIVTSRDSHLLRRRGMDDIYTVKGLNNNDALRLFSWRAFKKPYPKENYVDLSKDLVNYANGLPLALKVLGSLLFEKRIDEWKSALYKLKQEPDRNIVNILQISFDCLMDTRLLPELPLNIMYINADGCMSLETLPIRPEDDFRPCLSFRNCIKLINSQGYDDMFLTMLRRYIQGAYLGYEFFLIPGSEIPKWFSHQSVGTSLNLQGPFDFMGIVVCAVFIFRKHRPLPTTPWGFTHYLHFSYNVMGSEISDSHGIIFYEQSGPGLEVTKCGARLVYKQDIEDLKQTMAGSSRCSISPYEDDLDDSAKETKIKRSRDDFHGDEAGPSGEATISEVDIPHPKRIRLPNLIERFIPHLGNWIGNSSTQEEGDSNCEEEKSQ